MIDPKLTEQWEKEADKLAYPFGYSPKKCMRLGYVTGRQAAFDEVARLQAENETLKIEIEVLKGLLTLDGQLELQAELERVTKERDELKAKLKMREPDDYEHQP